MKRLLIALTIILSAITATAYPWSLPERPDTTVWFVNLYPGAEVYQLEGHSALVVQIPGQPERAYNYGIFDFNSPNFIGRYVMGETDYLTVCWPYDPFMAQYYEEGRRAVAHELDLDSATTRRLVDLLQWQALPENRTYRYNYVKDNCATRPLAAVATAVGDSIHLGPAPFEANSSMPMTFRNIMRYYHRHYPWYQFGIDLALGSGIDHPISRREAAFAPVELDAMLATATVGGKPLVRSTAVLIDRAPDAAIEGPTPWYATPLAVCWTVFALALALSIGDLRRKKLSRWFDSAYFGLLGLAGCLLTFLIFISVHEATSPNYLYAWLNPLCLFPAIFIWLKKYKKELFCYQIVNFTVLFVLTASWAWLPQSANPAFLPLILAEMMRSTTYIYIYRQQ